MKKSELDKNIIETTSMEMKLSDHNHVGVFNEAISVESVKLNKESNQIEVVMREPSNMIYTSNPPRMAADKIWKNVFAVSDDGKIFFKERIDAKVTPEQFIPEKVEFPEK